MQPGQSTKGSTQPAIDNKSKLQKDLDFSFMSISGINELVLDETLEPREVGLKPKKPEKKESCGKYDTRVVRLNNNKMIEIKELPVIFEQILLDPQAITWLDLSFNELTTIDTCLCDLGGLQILYLHSNAIVKIQEVDKLAGLPMLRKLSLHGNPIAGEKFYKPYVLTQIRQLQSFDMTAITKCDRQTAETLKSMTPQRRGKKPKDA